MRAPLLARLGELERSVLCCLAALVPLAFAVTLFEPYLAIKESLVQTGAVTAAALWFMTASSGSLTLAITPVWIPIIGLALAGGVSVLWSSHPLASVEAGGSLFFYLLLFAVTLCHMWRPEHRAQLTTALTAAGTVEAVYVLMQYSLGDPILLTDRLPGKWRTFGTLGNPNWTGEFLAVTALITLGRVVDLSRNNPPLLDSKRKASRSGSERKPRPARRAALLALILMLLALAATLARGAWMAFLIGATAFTFLRRADAGSRRACTQTSRPRRWRWPPAAAFGMGAAAALVVLPLLGNQEAINHLLNLKSVRGRIWMWAVTCAMIKDAPWVGHGPGTFRLHFPLYQARAFSQQWATPFIPNASFTSWAHNDYLQLWAEAGLCGLLAFGMLVWILLRRGRVLSDDPVVFGCWAALISLLVNAAIAFPLHMPTSLMLFVLLLGAVEGAASTKNITLSLSAPQARLGILLLALSLCLPTYHFSYQRLTANAALLRARAALERRDWNEAETAIRAAIHHGPARLEGYSMLGRLHVERGEYDRALRALDEAMRLGFATDVYDWKAMAYERVGRRAAAITTLKELAWLRPDLRWPRQRLSALSRADGNRKEDE